MTRKLQLRHQQHRQADHNGVHRHHAHVVVRHDPWRQQDQHPQPHAGQILPLVVGDLVVFDGAMENPLIYPALPGSRTACALQFSQSYDKAGMCARLKQGGRPVRRHTNSRSMRRQPGRSFQSGAKDCYELLRAQCPAAQFAAFNVFTSPAGTAAGLPGTP